MKRLLTVFLLCLTFITVISCSNNNSKPENADSIQIELLPSSSENLVNTPQFWHVDNRHLVVLFGYEFNEEADVEKILSAFESKYGLAENGGLIYPLVFPNAFLKYRRGFDSGFYQELTDSDFDVCGIVLLGAPDHTNRALGKNIDFWKQNVPYCVVSLFPQDDISGMQGTCDLVIEKAQLTDLAGNFDEENQISVDYLDVIEKTFDFVLACDGPLPLRSNLSLKNYAEVMLPGYEMHAYIDPETGIQFKNHFVIK